MKLVNFQFDLVRPEIFPKSKVISGVTKKNLNTFQDTGLSVAAGEIMLEEEVLVHRMYLAKYLGITNFSMKYQKQVHGSKIRLVDEDSTEEESDGMITNTKGITLALKLADCCGILVYDPINECIGAFHSGWRGTKSGILPKGIEMLHDTFSSNPEDLLVYITPCASGDKYEVEYDVAKYFPDTTQKISEIKYLFDNKAELFNQLLQNGVKKNNIEISDICTIESDEFHSYRRDGKKSGRMAAFIGLKSV